MTNELYKDIIEKQIEKCKELLISKGIEYHKDKDPLHNFNVGGAMIGKTPKEALAGYMLKHTISIYDMITSGEKYPIEKWEEKITDHINYLLILKACVMEESNADNNIDDVKSKVIEDIMNDSGGIVFDEKLENIAVKSYDKSLMDYTPQGTHEKYEHQQLMGIDVSMSDSGEVTPIYSEPTKPSATASYETKTYPSYCDNQKPIAKPPTVI